MTKVSENNSDTTASPGKLKSTPAKKKPKRFMKQPNMYRMVYALMPLAISAIYFFGWRVVAVLATVYAAGLLTEYFTSKSRGGPVTSACLVTCMLFGLSLPPTVPYYVAVVGIVVGILFGKEVFGGFGRNFVNPAILGRAFVYICFPKQLTGAWVPDFKGLPGGFAHWSFESLTELPSEYATATGQVVVDAVSQASPMFALRDWQVQPDYWDMFWGNMGRVVEVGGKTQIITAGSMGEACAPLILLAAVYLLWTKTAQWRLMLSGFLGVLFANILFRNVMGFDAVGKEGVPPVLFNLLAGTSLYALVFMVTDPVSAPKQKAAQLAYGFIIGVAMVFMRWKGVFVAAASFAILFGNIVGPLLDIGAEEWKKRQKARAAAAQATRKDGA